MAVSQENVLLEPHLGHSRSQTPGLSTAEQGKLQEIHEIPFASES